jgi:hypothetical protein
MCYTENMKDAILRKYLSILNYCDSFGEKYVINTMSETDIMKNQEEGYYGEL